MKHQGAVKTIDSQIQQFKVANPPDRLIEGYFTTIDVDRIGDVSLPSAFEKTMETYMKNPILTFMHNVSNVIGKVLEYRIEETGIWIKAQIAKGVKLADEVWALIEQGIIKGFSYGYKTLVSEPGMVNGKKVNYLKEVELYEISVVTLPMNGEALFSLSADGMVKSISLNLDKVVSREEESKFVYQPEDEKALTHNSNVKENEPAWSSIDKTELPRIAFADMGEEDKKSTWKYPHHWVSNGTLYLHKGGLHAAWAAANGARSGVEASAAVKSHLQAHRRAIGEDEKLFENEEELWSMTMDEMKQVIAESIVESIPKIAEAVVAELKRKEDEEASAIIKEIEDKKRQEAEERAKAVQAALKEITVQLKELVMSLNKKEEN